MGEEDMVESSCDEVSGSRLNSGSSRDILSGYTNRARRIGGFGKGSMPVQARMLRMLRVAKW